MSVRLSDEHWEAIWVFLQAQAGIYIGNEAKTRRFIEAILWITRSGSQWRLLPAAYRHWNSTYKRFARWQKRCLWQRLFEQLSADPDLENAILDRATVRAHPCAAGARKVDGGQADRRTGGDRRREP